MDCEHLRVSVDLYLMLLWKNENKEEALQALETLLRE